MSGECRSVITIIDYNSVGLVYMLDNFKLKIMQAFNFWLPKRLFYYEELFFRKIF